MDGYAVDRIRLDVAPRSGGQPPGVTAHRDPPSERRSVLEHELHEIEGGSRQVRERFDRRQAEEALAELSPEWDVPVHDDEARSIEEGGRALIAGGRDSLG